MKRLKLGLGRGAFSLFVFPPPFHFLLTVRLA